MRKTLIYISVIIAATLLIYTVSWFLIISSIAGKINQQYSNRYIATNTVDNEQKYFVKFNKITSYGFPFKIAFQVIGWYEEGENSIIEFHTPIYIGYDLLKQVCFITYSGNATGRYKPIQSGFGAKFESDNYSFTAKIPLSLKLFKIFIQKKDPFEIINFVKELELRSDKTKIFDLIDQQKLYDEDHTAISFSLEKKKYYTDLEDFKNNVPQKLNISYSTNILESNLINRRVPAGLLLYRFAWPMPFSFEGKFYIKTNKSIYSEFVNDLAIKMISSKFSSNVQDSLTSLLYQNKEEESHRASHLKVESTIDLKSGFSDNILNSIQYLLPYISALPNNLSLMEELEYVNNNKDKFNLTELENHQYIFDLDVNFFARINDVMRAQIHNLSLFSNNTGFRLSSECKLNSFGNFDINGLLVVNNYLKVTDIITNYLLNLGRFKTFSEDSRIVYKEGINYFLKTVSDHPDSNSGDISFEYKLDSNNIEKGKIGTVDLDKFLPLYYLALYKKASEKIRVGDIVNSGGVGARSDGATPISNRRAMSDDVTNSLSIDYSITKRIQELVPDFNEHQKLLKQLMIQPFLEIDSDFWQEVYNDPNSVTP
ncbi:MULTISPECIES: hypothetical protein [unclassified Candidatus Tisiphia]|uniref:hypothetical protein n=1 Tax=unclassified Candidatus Tisiphia TaxID=2996318 RepID=UPI003CCAFBCA